MEQPPLRAWPVLLVVLAALGMLGCRAGAGEADGQREQHRNLARLNDLGNAFLAGRTVLLGSSTLARWPQGLGPATMVNLGLPGDTVPSLVRRAQAYGSLAQAGQVVLNIGLNDLRERCSLDAMDLAALTRALPAGVPVLWFGIQGVAPSVREQWCGGRFVELSRGFNLMAARTCATLAACRFVEHPVPEDVGTPASAHWHVADGVHLSPAGYEALAARLYGSALVPNPERRP
ncbi:SGNH/GDSL hydrolase family protein [Pseudorhodoferax sp.]|uniref:SGNH/GDSL hydrolase family protein n=1 Tax=Pseudorhodoferax sp. TaxID=1993553 RepID=UPI002DD63839|nr:SGNH/GDSL hydrolase family protein [Pseudorhodoferax sp.]